MGKPGHNSKVKGPFSNERLKSFIERIERVEEERKALAADVRDIYAEAKGVGYDVGTMRKVIRLRAMSEADRAEQQTLLETYLHALGMIDRIDARLEAGESQRAIAAAEGVSKSTVQRRGPKVVDFPEPSKMDHHDPATGEIIEKEETDIAGAAAGRPSEPSDPAEQSVNPDPSPGRVSPSSIDGQGEQPGTQFDDARKAVWAAPDPVRVERMLTAEAQPEADLDALMPPHLRRPKPSRMETTDEGRGA